jgi:hypothetical protein
MERISFTGCGSLATEASIPHGDLFRRGYPRSAAGELSLQQPLVKNGGRPENASNKRKSRCLIFEYHETLVSIDGCKWNWEDQCSPCPGEITAISAKALSIGGADRYFSAIDSSRIPGWTELHIQPLRQVIAGYPFGIQRNIIQSG